MKKLGNKGFVLAETLIVTVFMMVLFTMIYTNFYPLIGLYEQRESYDDIDGKYTVYWIKKLIEKNEYNNNEIRKLDDPEDPDYVTYVRFNCNDMSVDNNSREVCESLVNEFEINGCNRDGSSCDIFITKYTIGGDVSVQETFKNTVFKKNKKKYNENCSGDADWCKIEYYQNCCLNNGVKNCNNINGTSPDDHTNSIMKKCQRETKKNVFSSAFVDYIKSLPDFTSNEDNIPYRVFLVVHHQKGSNNYYSFANMEVKK